MLAAHRLPAAIVALAVASTAAFFLFARPEYRGPGSPAHDVKPLSYVSPAAHGWVWPLGTPGFRIGHDEDRWNMSGIHWRDLAGLRFAARRAHVDPQSLRVLDAARLRPRGRPFLLVGGRSSTGQTCIGAQAGDARPPRLFCPSALRGRVAILVASPRAGYASGARSIFVDGVVSAAVVKVTIRTPSAAETLYDRATYDHTWGTFLSYRIARGPWRARLTFLGARGELAEIDLHYAKAAPGFVYCASAFSGAAGDCAHLRS